MIMHVRIIAVGKVKEKYLREGIAEYEKRLRSYLDLQILEINEEKRPASASPSIEKSAMEREGGRILAAIPPGSFTIALDIKGKDWSSRELAESFRQWELAGKSRITFIIGGDLGLDKEVLSQSDMRLSLSNMTYTHPMARFLLLEQVYRVCRINSGEPYHK
jgi:23S rRNA (pseudouridine1915-N3)-methyltransferase